MKCTDICWYDTDFDNSTEEFDENEFGEIENESEDDYHYSDENEHDNCECENECENEQDSDDLHRTPKTMLWI